MRVSGSPKVERAPDHPGTEACARSLPVPPLKLAAFGDFTTSPQQNSRGFAAPYQESHQHSGAPNSLWFPLPSQAPPGPAPRPPSRARRAVALLPSS
jgi:hypothetical protein